MTQAAEFAMHEAPIEATPADVRAAVLKILEQHPGLPLRNLTRALWAADVHASAPMAADAIVDLLTSGAVIMTAQRELKLA